MDISKETEMVTVSKAYVDSLIQTIADQKEEIRALKYVNVELTDAVNALPD